MHRYNNQDHSMMTALITTRNILEQKHIYNPWLVNEDAEYHESGASCEEAFDIETGLRDAPKTTLE